MCTLYIFPRKYTKINKEKLKSYLTSQFYNLLKKINSIKIN